MRNVLNDCSPCRPSRECLSAGVASRAFFPKGPWTRKGFRRITIIRGGVVVVVVVVVAAAAAAVAVTPAVRRPDLSFFRLRVVKKCGGLQ